MTCCIKTPCKCSHCSSWPSPANGILLHGVQKPRARLGSSVMSRGMTRLHGGKARLETSLHYSPPGRLEAGPFQLLLLGNLKGLPANWFMAPYGARLLCSSPASRNAPPRHKFWRISLSLPLWRCINAARAPWLPIQAPLSVQTRAQDAGILRTTAKEPDEG